MKKSNSAFITAYERDNESDLDFAQARYYSSKLGRFYSVDPENAGASEDDPQSWNGYAYARNNPTIFTDPDGLEVQYCDTNRVCVTLTSKEEKDLFNKDLQASLGNKVKGGQVVNSNGDVIATYTNNNNIMQMLRGFRPMGEAALPYLEAMTPAPLPFLGVAAKAFQIGNKVRKALPILQGICFIEGTPILTENGLKPIEEIREGDKVLSYNEQTKQTEYKTVVQTMVREAEAGRILSVKVEGEEALGVTGEHPFYVRVHKARDNTASEDDEGEWIEAKDLRIGDEIRKADGT